MLSVCSRVRWEGLELLQNKKGFSSIHALLASSRLFWKSKHCHTYLRRWRWKVDGRSSLSLSLPIELCRWRAAKGPSSSLSLRRLLLDRKKNTSFYINYTKDNLHIKWYIVCAGNIKTKTEQGTTFCEHQLIKSRYKFNTSGIQRSNDYYYLNLDRCLSRLLSPKVSRQTSIC